MSASRSTGPAGASGDGLVICRSYYECGICRKRFIYLHSIKLHLKKHNERAASYRMSASRSTGPAGASGDGLVICRSYYECGICRKRFIYLHSIKLHLKKHNERAASYRMSASRSTGPAGASGDDVAISRDCYECAVCRKRFFCLHAIKLHLKEHKCVWHFVDDLISQYVPGDEVPRAVGYKCIICGRKFLRLRSGEVHIRKYEFPFQPRDILIMTLIDLV